MKKSEIQNKFITGSIKKSFLSLIIPIMIGNLLQTTYNLTDTFWVGRLGKEAVAAVSLSFPVIFLIISLAGGVGMAGSILVSQYKGRKNNKQMTKVAGQTFLMIFILSIIFSFIGYIFREQIMILLGAGVDVMPLAILYFKYSMIGIIFVFGYMVFQGILRGAGDAKTPFYIVTGTVLLNFLLDPIFIFGYKKIPAFGVSGAAISTIFTQGLALLVGLIILVKGREGIKLTLKNFKVDFNLMKKIFKLGIPASLEQSSRSIKMIIMTILVASFGTVYLAGFGIGMRVFSFVIIPSLSLAISTSILVGQNIGANKLERAKKIPRYGMKLGFLSLTFVSILVFIFAKQIATVFVPGDLDVILITTQFLKISSITYSLIGIQMTIFGAIKGAGKTKLSMSIAISLLIIQIAIALLLSNFMNMGAVGIWISYPVTEVIGTLITLYIFFKTNWENEKII